ncbi:MAG: hypothetical protein ACIAXF_07520, partial [Phycisphaerales bacterium JB063]
MRLRFPTRCLLAAATLGCASTAQSQVLSEWLSPVDGNWGNALFWSTPVAPNNVGGTTYDALIAAGGASQYTIRKTFTFHTIDSVTINDPFARLEIEGGGFTADVIDVMAGELFTGQTLIQNAQVMGTGRVSPIVWELASTSFSGSETRLQDVNFSASVDFSRWAGTISNKAYLDFLTSTVLDDGVQLTFASDITDVTLVNGASISTPGQATIVLGTQLNTQRTTSSSSSEIGAGITIEAAGAFVPIFADNSALPLLNHGVITARGNGDIASIFNLTNFGTIAAVNAGEVNITGSFTNTGTLHVEAGSVFM